MRFRNLLLAGLLIASGSVWSENLIKNGNFSSVGSNNRPDNWEVRLNGGNQCTAADGVFTLQAAGDSTIALALQRDVPVKSGKKYVMLCETKGDAGSEYYFYLEYRRTVNGKPGAMASFNTVRQKASAEYKLNKFVFTFPENAGGAYLVIRSVKGSVSFRNVQIVDFSSAAPADSLVKNGYFDELAGSRPVDWELRGSGCKTLPAESGNILSISEGSLAMQRDLLYKPQEKYTMRCQVRSDAAENFFVFYSEWTLDGNLRSAICPAHKAGSEWSDCQISFVFPAGAVKPYIVLASRKGAVEFRNVSIVKAE